MSSPGSNLSDTPKRDNSPVTNLQKALQKYLHSIGENPERDGLLETPHRFTKQLQECLAGYADDPEQHLKVFDNDGYHDLVVVRDITFSSLCEHHMLPFFGTIDVAYLPKDKILGLSKFARITDALSKRLQVQERITKQLADLLEKKLQPDLLMINISAKHMCMSMRGVVRRNSVTETSIIRGDSQKHAKYVERFYGIKKGHHNDYNH